MGANGFSFALIVEGSRAKQKKNNFSRFGIDMIQGKTISRPA